MTFTQKGKERRGGENGEKKQKRKREEPTMFAVSRFPEESSGLLVFNNEMVMSPKVGEGIICDVELLT